MTNLSSALVSSILGMSSSQTAEDALQSMRTALNKSNKAHNQAEMAAIINGQSLFFDKSLSFDNTTSCADCHIPRLGFSDGLTHPISRNRALTSSPKTPSLLDVGRRKGPYFWNGRAVNLIAQAFWPLYQQQELGASPQSLQKFGGSQKVAHDLASYVASITTSIAPWDYFLQGNVQILSYQEKLGARVFFERAKCQNCHTGPEFSGHKLESLNYQNLSPRLFKNEEISYSGDIEFSSSFNRETRRIKSIPISLRNLALKTGPYGRFGGHITLEAKLKSHPFETEDKSNLTNEDRLNLISFLLISLRSANNL